MKWIKTKDRLPPDKWSGLIITDVRPDKPVFAHVADKWYRKEFPYRSYFLGRWRESILIGEHMRYLANIIMWLDTEGENLYPSIPSIKE